MTRNQSTYIVSGSAHIDADPALVYAVIADYHEGHPRILPEPFTGLVVERGGVGAGTIISVSMRVFGRMQTFRSEVSEPEPGHVLVEHNVTGTPSVTTFTVRPGESSGADVTIATELAYTYGGLLGGIERRLATRFLQPIYGRELRRLADVARELRDVGSMARLAPPRVNTAAGVGTRRRASRLASRAIVWAATLAAAVTSVGCTAHGGTSVASAAGSAAARGEYLVTIGGCNDCHTPLQMGPKGPEPDMTRMLSGHPEAFTLPAPPVLAPDGPWNWAGSATSTAFSGPWGVSFAANLTPDQNTGLGIWTEDMFIKALRGGRHMGASRPILPPMPWPGLSRATDDDLRAIFAYLRTIRPITNHVPEPREPTNTSAN